jgi:release factor glutamine methyltransferase
VTSEWTPLRLLEWTTRRFTDANIDSPRLAAQVLLAHALECDRVQLYVQHDKPLGPDELGRYRELVRRRLAGESVAYLTGQQEFWSLPLAVDHRVLVPRRDTETLIEAVLDRISDRAAPLRLVDIGTGSGAVALALARELPAAQVVATDLSPEALEVAGANAARLGLAERVELRPGDLLAALGRDERFDLLVSNPPYVPAGEIEKLAAEVRAEPRRALDGGPDGLDLLRRLIAGAADHLATGGLLALEHGFDQGEAVRALIAATGLFAAAETRVDLGGKPRVTTARLG